MGDVLAVVSKAVFEKQAPKGLALGGGVAARSLRQQDPGLSSLSEGGALCSRLSFDGEQWVGRANVAKVVDVALLRGGDRRWVPKQLWKRKKIGFEAPMAFSPDGQHLLVMPDEGPRILDAATGQDV